MGITGTELQAVTKKGLATHGVAAVFHGEPQNPLKAEIEGREVRVEAVDDADEPQQYRVTIRATDVASGETLGRGNGGADLDEAGEVFQWQGLLADLRQLASS